MLKQVLLQVILILFNAFFAATEIAVISLNEKKVKARAENGDRKAKLMLRMIEGPTRFLSTIQVGITLAGFLGSAFAADNFAERLSAFAVTKFNISNAYIGTINTVSVVIITLILSFFTLVLGELVPKRIAMRHKEKFAEMVCPIISVLAVVLKPIIWFLTVSTNGVLRILGIDPNEKEEPVSEEDIVIMLDAGVDEGTLDEDDIEYIKNVFKLDNLTAADIMKSRNAVAFISETDTSEDILNVIEAEGYSRIPIYSESIDKVVGILHTKEYLLKHNNPDFELSQATLPATYVPESMHLDSLLKDMQTNHNHMVIVVNEYGITSGIVTIEDILEELVGEIWDEQDEAFNSIEKIDENSYRVLCSISLEEFFEFFEKDVPDETDAITVNGWLIENSGNIPQIGYTFVYDDIEITVTQADDVMTHEICVKIVATENLVEKD